MADPHQGTSKPHDDREETGLVLSDTRLCPRSVELFDLWRGLQRPDQQVPLWGDFDPLDVPAQLSGILVLERLCEPDEQFLAVDVGRLRCRLCGTGLVGLFKVELTGRCLEEFPECFPNASCAEALQAVLCTRAPYFWRGPSAFDGDTIRPDKGQDADLCEVLMLPFETKEGRADIILCYLVRLSPGPFEHWTSGSDWSMSAHQTIAERRITVRKTHEDQARCSAAKSARYAKIRVDIQVAFEENGPVDLPFRALWQLLESIGLAENESAARLHLDAVQGRELDAKLLSELDNAVFAELGGEKIGSFPIQDLQDHLTELRSEIEGTPILIRDLSDKLGELCADSKQSASTNRLFEQMWEHYDSEDPMPFFRLMRERLRQDLMDAPNSPLAPMRRALLDKLPAG
jgi:hypothetical protein